MVEEILYPAMEDFNLDLIIGQGPSARSVKLELPPLHPGGGHHPRRAAHLAAAGPLRHDAAGWISTGRRSWQDRHAGRARCLEIDIEADGAAEIARRSRGTPRIANRLLRRVRDYAQVKGDGRINKATADAALTLLDIDQLGLDRMDRQILRLILENYYGGPVGLGTLAAALCEEEDTLEDVYEPYLIQSGFLQRTPRGRMATGRAAVVVSGRCLKRGRIPLYFNNLVHFCPAKPELRLTGW